MVKNKTTDLILVFKEFLEINSTTDFCTLCKRVSRFSLEKFSSQSAVGEPFSVSSISGIKKFVAYEENITIFYRKFVVSRNRKTSQGNPSVFHKISGIEKIYG